MRARGALHALLLGAALFTACDALPFVAQPSPSPAPTPPPTPSPTPTLAPKPKIEVTKVHLAPVEKAGPKFVAVAFRLRNPSSGEWLFQATATATLSTPDGRLLPQVKPSGTIDLAPGEEKWFAFGSVDTFGSVIGKAEIAVTGGQWLPGSAYPYPGGVPLTAARKPAGATPAPASATSAEFVVTNSGDLGVNGVVRGFAFEANDVFVGLVECPARLYPARTEVAITCATLRPENLKAPQLLFVAYADLRQVIVIPTASPTARP